MQATLSTTMRRGGGAALISAVIALAGCGGHDFTGMYQGDVHRVDQASSADVAASATVTINSNASQLTWSRGSEMCDLQLETGQCSHGCYDKVILSGQTCTIEGQTLVLVSGLLESQLADIPDNGIRMTMTWAATADGTPRYVDSGVLARQ